MTQSPPPSPIPSPNNGQNNVVPGAAGQLPELPREYPLIPALAAVETPYFHILGYSVAGEESAIQVPELNINFDIGKCPRPMLTSDFCLLSHGHIDHSAGIVYYLSQRFFQGMSAGTVLCPAKIAEPLSKIIHAWAGLEGKVTEHRIIPMNVGDEFEIRKGLIARAFAVRHRVPAIGFTLIDRREKLKPELLAQNLPGHILRKMKDNGEQITYTMDVPLVAYTGDTCMGETLLQPGVMDAKVLITECTFYEPDHRKRASVGEHLHVSELLEVLPQLQNELVLLTHVSRRTHLRAAKGIFKEQLTKLREKRKAEALSAGMPEPKAMSRVEFFMDYAQRLQVRPGKAAPMAIKEQVLGPNAD